MNHKEQLEEWVNGNPIHNKEIDECCPDFSCCNGKIAPIEERLRFKKAFDENDEKTKIMMLIMFMRNSLSEINVHILDEDSGCQEH